MADEVQQNFVRCFINFLKKQLGGQAFTPDSQESCEVAIQCLQAAFDLNDDEPEPAGRDDGAANTSNASNVVQPWNAKNIDLFELYELQYLEKNSDNLALAETIKNEGNRLMKDGKYNEALLQYSRAITYDPKNPIFYCNRAAAYIRLGENERAIIDCKSALLYNSNYGKAYGRLGIAYSNLTKYDEAEQAYAKAIELEPDNQDFRNNLQIARNARTQLRDTIIPQLTGSMETMLNNPTIRETFRSVGVDIQQIQNLTQNPIIAEGVRQIFECVMSSDPLTRDSPDIQAFVQRLRDSVVNDLHANASNDANNDQQQQQPPNL